MLLVIDNYDSFTYNLVQYLGELGQEIVVFRNDQITLEEIAALQPRKILISPGPGRPENAGISIALIQKLGRKIPILGVCLGHQAIGAAFGAEVICADRLMHGKTSMISHDKQSIYHELPMPFEATRYHSLILRKESLPDVFEISSWTDAGEIMGIRHKRLPIEGVQFHPESILTKAGKALLNNFLNL